MRKRTHCVAFCIMLVGCAGRKADEADVAATSQQKLEAAAMQALTKKQGGLTSQDELVRQADTLAYYNRVEAITTLDRFTSRYRFDASQVTATYYNRGDLGIGREMHCSDKYLHNFEKACYVRNFAAGDDGTEFTFGLSKDIAFRNIENGHLFATVAMSFSATRTDAVQFFVFGADGNRINVKSAPLDRAGIAYDNVFKTGQTPVGLGTPGVNFNNNIPTGTALVFVAVVRLTGMTRVAGTLVPIVGDASRNANRWARTIS